MPSPLEQALATIIVTAWAARPVCLEAATPDQRRPEPDARALTAR
jgi:hypothetical protein